MDEEVIAGSRTVTDAAFASGFLDDRVKGIKAEIVLPYIKGISLSDYARVMDDEADLVIEFRSSIKQMLDQVKDDTVVLEEFVNDVVRPRISKIERSYQRISAASGLKAAGATVAAAALTLTSYLSQGPAAAITAVASGAGALSALKELADRRDKLGAIKDDPLYLLWRLKREATRKEAGVGT